MNQEDAAWDKAGIEMKSRYQRSRYRHSYSGNDTQKTRKGNYVENKAQDNKKTFALW